MKVRSLRDLFFSTRQRLPQVSDDDDYFRLSDAPALTSRPANMIAEVQLEARSSFGSGSEDSCVSSPVSAALSNRQRSGNFNGAISSPTSSWPQKQCNERNHRRSFSSEEHLRELRSSTPTRLSRTGEVPRRLAVKEPSPSPMARQRSRDSASVATSNDVWERERRGKVGGLNAVEEGRLTPKKACVNRRGFTKWEADENGFDVLRGKDRPKTPHSPLSKLISMRWALGAGANNPSSQTFVDLDHLGSGSPASVSDLRVLGPTGVFEKEFEVGEEIERGSRSILSTCRRRIGGGGRSDEMLCCRTVVKESLVAKEDIDAVRGEVQILKRLGGHPNILQLHGVFEDDVAVRMVTDLCIGEDIVERMAGEASCSERAVADTMRVILGVVEHCHSHSIVHRGIRLGRFRHVNRLRGAAIMAVDFRDASFISPGELLSGHGEHSIYTAPEVIDGEHGLPCDIWSAGVCLHILLCGVPPFQAATSAEQLALRRNAELDLSSPVWASHVSAEAKDLLRCMLSQDPQDRPTASQALAHPWMSRTLGASPGARLSLKPLREFADGVRVQQQILSAVAEGLTEPDLPELTALLNSWDGRGAGTVTLGDLLNCLSQLSRPELDSRMQRVVKSLGWQEQESHQLDYKAMLDMARHRVRRRWERQLAAALRRAEVAAGGQLSVAAAHDACVKAGVTDVRGAWELFYGAQNPQSGSLDCSNFLMDLREAGVKVALLHDLFSL